MSSLPKNRYFALYALLLIILDQIFVSAVWFQVFPLQITSNRFLPISVTFSSALAVAGIMALWKFLPRQNRYGLFLMLAGTLSNFITNARFGRVVDYLPFFATKNNIADYLVVIGGAVVVVIELRILRGKTLHE